MNLRRNPRLGALVVVALALLAPAIALRPIEAGAAADATEPPSPHTSWGAFVDAIHVDLLGVAASPAARADAVADLQTGTVTAGAFVAGLRATDDHVQAVDPMVRLYRAAFLRSPDVGGLDFWLARRRAGTWTLVRIASTFAGSSEFSRRYGALGDRAFVEQIYRNVLGRAGDPGGIAYWTRQLDLRRKSRGHVLASFSESSEHRRTQAPTVDVVVLRTLLLDAAPTPAQVQADVDELGSIGLPAYAATLLRADRYRARFAPPTGITERASVSSVGGQAAQGAYAPEISADGRFVAFTSSSQDLVDGDPERAGASNTDALVHDRLTGTTELVSVTDRDAPANGGSQAGAISGDGRYVAFLSDATNLVARNTNAQRDAFVRDRVAGTTTRVSATIDGEQGDVTTGTVDISDDGRMVLLSTFVSSQADVPGPPLVLVDRLTGDRQFVRPADAAAGETAGGWDLSGDGSTVAFTWSHRPQTPEEGYDTYGYVWDRATATATRISGPPETTATSVTGISTSADGALVSFVASVRETDTTAATSEVVVWSRATGATTPATDALVPGTTEPIQTRLSGDGRWLAVAVVLPDDSGERHHVVLIDLIRRSSRVVDASADGVPSDRGAADPRLSFDGRVIVYQSLSSDLVGGDTNGQPDAFSWLRPA